MSTRLEEKIRLISDGDLHRELWRRGDLGYLLLPDGQSRAYRALIEWKSAHPTSRLPFVVVTHRGAGKSYMLATIGVARCCQRPGQIVRFGSPSYKQSVEILGESMPKILANRPPSIKVYETEQYIRFTNEAWPKGRKYSWFWKFGANRETIESQRGLRSHMLLLDEVRDWDDLDYALNEVLYFQTARMESPCVVVASTLPKTPAHYFKRRLIAEAAPEGRYFELNIMDNSDVDDEEREELARSCGGKDSVAWKREAMCECLADESLMVVPEFLKNRDATVRPWKKPKVCYKFVSGDFGLKDATALLFAYIDFLAQKLIIADEYISHFQSTSQIAGALQKYREELAGDPPIRCLMVADATEQQLYDFQHDHGIYFQPAEKYDRWSALAALRGGFHDGRIVIDPICRNLIYQLESGIFNKRRTDFARSEMAPGEELQLGHLDAVAALIYLWRAARDYFRYSPFSAQEQSMEDSFISSSIGTRRGSGVLVTHRPLSLTRDTL